MEDFFVSAQQSGVVLRKNGAFDDAGKVVCVELHWSFSEFLRIGSDRIDLHTRAQRAFNIDGVEINDCMMIGDTDSIFLSLGEDFISPTPVTYGADAADIGELDCSMPSYVGMYNVGALLGCGAFGEVRLGTNKLTDEKVALKFLRKAEIQSMGAAERTSTEIQCLTTLNHRNIIRLFMRVEIHRFVVLVFDLMEGGDMFQYLNQRGSTAADAALSDDEARRVFTQVLAGIDFAHKHRIIHRDLKLENLLLKDNSLRLVKIADFGLSQFCRPGVLIKSDGSGTLSTAAPELLSTKGCNEGPPIDVWALGVVLFALLCGRLPFEGPDLTGDPLPIAQIRRNILKCKYTIDDRVSNEAKDLLRRILRVDPAERATTSQIHNHSWLRPRVCAPKGEDFGPEIQNDRTSFGSNTASELDGAELYSDIVNKGARERVTQKLTSITEDNSSTDYTKDRSEREDSPLPCTAIKGIKSSTSPSSSVKPKSLSLSPVRRSPSFCSMRMCCSALDDLTDELDKSILDSTPSNCAALSLDFPTPIGYSSSSSLMDPSQPLPLSLDSDSLKARRASPLDCESLCDIKGWGVPRVRNSSGTGPRSPSYDRSQVQVRVPTRTTSCEALLSMDGSDDGERMSRPLRVVSDDKMKGVSRHSSSFSFRPSLSSTATSSSSTTSYSSRNGSIRSVSQLSPNNLSDELDKRLISLDKRLLEADKNRTGGGGTDR